MAIALLHKYELFIGQIPALALKEKEKDATKVDLTPPSEDVKTVTESDESDDTEIKDFIKLTNHHMEATIKYPREGSSKKEVTQVIKIYNPSKATVAKAKSGTIVVLKAGYNTDQLLPVICAAQIKKASVKKDKTNRVLTILCAEATNIRSTVKYAKTFAPTTTYAEVIDDILSVYAAYGIPAGQLNLTIEAQTKQVGDNYTIMGSLNKVLAKACKAAKLHYYISGGEVFVRPKASTENESVNILRVEQKNVKNSVEAQDDTTNKTPSQKTARTKGIVVTVNLQGNINKSDGLEIVKTAGSSEAFNAHEGKYKITSVTHHLSYEKQKWDTVIEASA